MRYHYLENFKNKIISGLLLFCHVAYYCKNNISKIRRKKKNSPLMLFNRLTRHKHYKRRLFAKSTSVIKINKNRTYMSINILKYKNKYFTTVYFHNFLLILPIGYQDLLAFISLCLGKPLAHQKKVCHYLSKWLFTPELVNFLFIIKTIIF